jgi:hypothetical protein
MGAGALILDMSEYRRQSAALFSVHFQQKSVPATVGNEAAQLQRVDYYRRTDRDCGHHAHHATYVTASKHAYLTTS